MCVREGEGEGDGEGEGEGKGEGEGETETETEGDGETEREREREKGMSVVFQNKKRNGTTVSMTTASANTHIDDYNYLTNKTFFGTDLKISKTSVAVFRGKIINC